MTAERSLRPVESAPIDYSIMEQVIIKGDLSRLSAEERANYYVRVCTSVGLNPLTKPFEYITLNGKLTLYALKGATDQLRSLHGINIVDTKPEYVEELIVVTVAGEDRFGRRDSEIGAVTIGGLKGDAKANALMKALTKAKRRLTLSMCGLGMLDESEVETIPSARAYTEPTAAPRLTAVPEGEVVDHDTGEITIPSPVALQREHEQSAPSPNRRSAARPLDADVDGSPDPNRLKASFALGTSKGLERDEIKTLAYHRYGVTSMTHLTMDQVRDFYSFLNKNGDDGLRFELSQARAALPDDATFTEVSE